MKKRISLLAIIPFVFSFNTAAFVQQTDAPATVEVISVNGSSTSTYGADSTLPGYGYSSGGGGGGSVSSASPSEERAKCKQSAQDTYSPCFTSRETWATRAFYVCTAGATILPNKYLTAAVAYGCAVTRDDARSQNQQYCLENVIELQADC
ncbi:MAG: hypothetical protein ACJAS1_004706 [Oleiphilaceae bacterium]|jgi:hypothetical protein